MKIVDNTPRTTPLAMTIPISLPSVNCITHKATKPAIVVIELEVIEVKVALIALAIASSFGRFCFSS